MTAQTAETDEALWSHCGDSDKKVWFSKMVKYSEIEKECEKERARERKKMLFLHELISNYNLLENQLRH